MASEDERKGMIAAEFALGRAARLLGRSEEGVHGLAEKVAASKVSHPVRVDRRFPNTNQVNNCWTALNEYQICVEKRGREDPSCLQRGRDYGTMCPQKWIEEWKEHVAAGKAMTVGKAFAGDA